MTDDTRVRDAAEYYFNAHMSRASYGILPDVARPQSLEEAYAVQEAFQALRTKQGRGAIAGYKLGLTSRIMQDLMGIDQPCMGGNAGSDPAGVTNDNNKLDRRTD